MLTLLVVLADAGRGNLWQYVPSLLLRVVLLGSNSLAVLTLLPSELRDDAGAEVGVRIRLLLGIRGVLGAWPLDLPVLEGIFLGG
jgi:hypothetical protein